MTTLDLRQNVIEYINTKADHKFLRLVNALAKTYQEEEEEIEERDTIEQYNQEVDQAISKIENGDSYTQEEVEKMANEW